VGVVGVADKSLSPEGTSGRRHGTVLQTAALPPPPPVAAHLSRHDLPLRVPPSLSATLVQLLVPSSCTRLQSRRSSCVGFGPEGLLWAKQIQGEMLFWRRRCFPWRVDAMSPPGRAHPSSGRNKPHSHAVHQHTCKRALLEDFIHAAAGKG